MFVSQEHALRRFPLIGQFAGLEIRYCGLNQHLSVSKLAAFSITYCRMITQQAVKLGFANPSVGCFNKNKLNRGLEFGRAYQLGRIGGNFLFVGRCDSVYMPDAQSLPIMLNTHEQLFGNDVG